MIGSFLYECLNNCTTRPIDTSHLNVSSTQKYLWDESRNWALQKPRPVTAQTPLTRLQNQVPGRHLSLTRSNCHLPGNHHPMSRRERPCGNTNASTTRSFLGNCFKLNCDVTKIKPTLVILSEWTTESRYGRPSSPTFQRLTQVDGCSNLAIVFYSTHCWSNFSKYYFITN